MNHCLCRPKSMTQNSVWGIEYLGMTGWKNRHLGDHHGFDHASVRYVRANAEINHGPAAVDGGGSAIGDLGLDEVFFILVVL
jgi:hypothetical protein